VYDFDSWDVRTRLNWIEWFQNVYGPGNRFLGWFNAIDAVLTIASQRNLIVASVGSKKGNWFSLGDAYILAAIQNGFVLFQQGKTAAGQTPASKWAAFFGAVSQPLPGPNYHYSRVPNAQADAAVAYQMSLWGQAEQAATDQGAAAATSARGVPNDLVKGAFIDLGNAFRSGVAGGLVDPRNWAETYVSVELALTYSAYAIDVDTQVSTS